jgi:hypothetical protein
MFMFMLGMHHVAIHAMTGVHLMIFMNFKTRSFGFFFAFALRMRFFGFWRWWNDE